MEPPEPEARRNDLRSDRSSGAGSQANRPDGAIVSNRLGHRTARSASGAEPPGPPGVDSRLVKCSQPQASRNDLGEAAVRPFVSPACFGSQRLSGKRRACAPLPGWPCDGADEVGFSSSTREVRAGLVRDVVWGPC